ncbi:hypothetical protein O181_035510 [Austropuccinia psidii MF-1]|uniref:Protein CPL1-like domain-containing protein n=1 Tax=Austropuccinia psidii MF-1 TaxID=1389203 RepID=A0A9Q3D4W4_9BASI|nr:hypothetical protein [Austropuccinia psidii MF-1]
MPCVYEVAESLEAQELALSFVGKDQVISTILTSDLLPPLLTIDNFRGNNSPSRSFSKHQSVKISSFLSAQATNSFGAATSGVANQLSSLAKHLWRIQVIADANGHTQISSRCAQANNQLSQCQASWQGISSRYIASPWLAKSSHHAPIVQGRLKQCGDFLSWLKNQPELRHFPEYYEPLASCKTIYGRCQSGCNQIWNWGAPPRPSPGSHQRYNKRHLPSNSCPGQESACPVSMGSMNIECIDTKSEITSCGGCVSKNEGENCLSISGADQVGCKEGKCVVLSVYHGYNLSREGRPIRAQ